MFWLRLHLRVAYATEIGAASAYRGHAAVTADPAVAAHISWVEAEERHHRARVGRMLAEFGWKPWKALDAFFFALGSTIGFLCGYWGEWASSFGAAQFEFGGIGDYRRAARAARRVGREDLAVELDAMEQDEADHRVFFLALARARRPLLKKVPLDRSMLRSLDEDGGPTRDVVAT